MKGANSVDTKVSKAVQRGEAEAQKLLNKYEVCEAPINIVRLAKKEGYGVIEATFRDKNISGGIQFKTNKNNGKMYVNASDSPLRQRFSLAHEVGHSCMHRNDPEYSKGVLEKIDMFRDSSNHNTAEIEANAFAAALLMPDNIVCDMWRKWRSTEILADIFKVSISAMSFRLYNLGLKGDW